MDDKKTPKKTKRQMAYSAKGISSYGCDVALNMFLLIWLILQVTDWNIWHALTQFCCVWQVVTQICQMIIGPISLIFCGHLGDAIKLDGAALAISVSRQV